MSVFYTITNTGNFRSNLKSIKKAALRIFVPVLIAVLATQVSFAQEKNKTTTISEKAKAEWVEQNGGENSKAVLLANKNAVTQQQTKISTHGVVSEVFSNAKGGFSYRILDGEKQILEQEVVSGSDASVKNRQEAERQGQQAVAIYKEKQNYSIAELASEILYQNNVTRSGSGGINFSTAALCTYTGVVETGDPQITGRIYRDGVASTCAAPKTCPAGTPFGTASFNYDPITISNTTGSSQCVTTTIQVTGGGVQMHAVAYLGSFNPANQCQNYLADCGSSSVGAAVTFSYTLAAGATVVIVVYNPIAGTATTNYTVTVDGLTCVGAPPTGPITITSQPVNATACPATNTSFTVAATPVGVSYNWQEDRGAGWAYLANGGVYSGATTGTLNLTGVTTTMNGYKYRCVLVSTGLPAISNEVTLTVPAAPTSTGIAPTSAAICPGGSQQLSVTAVTSPTTVSTSSGTIAVVIPDATAAGVTHTIPVSGIPAGVTVSSISVNFNISHTWNSDLVINLIAPNGKILNLVNQRGGSGDNFVNTVISSTSTTSLGTGTSPFTGTFAADGILNTGPTGMLSNVNGFSNLFSTPNGDWKLAFRDLWGGDEGTLTSWSIDITYGTGVGGIWTPITGLFTDAALTTAYTAGTAVASVYASPAATTTYSVVQSNGTCNSPASTATITVNQAPTITTHPASGLGCVGSSKTFTVSATGTALTYQWQVDDGTGFVNLTNTAPYTGTTTATLTINPVALSQNGYKYRVIVSGTCSPAATSNEAVFTVNSLPVITATPDAQCSPVALTAAGANTYTWSPAGGLSATSGATVTATVTSNTTYTVTGTNTATTCSNSTTISVVGKPSAPSLSPSSATICLGGSQLISVGGTQGFTNAATISIPDNGLTSPYPSIITASGLAVSGVTVKSVTLNSFSHTWHSDLDFVLVSPAGVSVILMSDVGGATNTTPGRTYTFDDAAAALMTTGSNLAGTYRPTNIGATDNFPAPGPGSLTQATPTLSMFGSGNHNGSWRLYGIDQYAGDQGTISGWTITFATGGSTVNFTPTTGLFTDAALTTAYTGTAVTGVYASPAVTTTYTATSSNSGPGPATANYTFNYTGAAISIPSSGVATPYPAPITVTGMPANAVIKSITLNGVTHTWPSDIDVLLQSPSGTNVTVMSDIGGSSAISGRVYTLDDAAAANLTSSNNASGTYLPTNSGATDNFPAPGPGSITLATPTLSLFGTSNNGTWNLYVIDDVGGDSGSITTWSITFTVPSTPTVCTSPPTLLTVTVHTPIVISSHPVNTTVCSGGNAVFSVTATGTIQTYQWQVSTDGGLTWSNVANATASSYTATNVQTTMNNYRYRCVISSLGCGANNSNAATLIVNPLPTVALSLNPVGQTQLRPGLVTRLTATSTPAGASYQWFLNGVAQPNITGATYIVDAYHLGSYSVRVTDINGCVSTTGSVLFTALASSNLFIYPNPTSGAYAITYYMPQVNSPITINVIDMKGRIIEVRNAVTTAPYTKFDFSNSKLAVGVYVIEFRDPGGDRLAAGRLVVTAH
ncbi:MAG: T9SS type A sorting domain-containing protein [Chitinophagaceae bacterium]|nr:MAG: T9SS type A sorting domain-containing protein [Chitinophagaceae bacterium]